MLHTLQVVWAPVVWIVMGIDSLYLVLLLFVDHVTRRRLCLPWWRHCFITIIAKKCTWGMMSRCYCIVYKDDGSKKFRCWKYVHVGISDFY